MLFATALAAVAVEGLDGDDDDVALSESERDDDESVSDEMAERGSTSTRLDGCSCTMSHSGVHNEVSVSQMTAKTSTPNAECKRV